MNSRVSRARRLAYGLLVTAVLFLVIEVGLRVALGAPPLNSFLVRISASSLIVQGDKGILHHRSDARQDVSVPLAKGTRPRVVFLGESSVRTFGAPEANFPFQVQRRIPEIEVVNFGTPGQLAAGMARLSAELDVLDPDLVVIYDGHNDYSEVVFRGAVRGTRLWMVPFYELLSASWILHGVETALARWRGEELDRLVHQRTASRFLPTDDDTVLTMRSAVTERFRFDLDQAVQASPAPVLLATLLRNFDEGPQGVLVAGHPTCVQLVQGLATNRASEPRVLEKRVTDACGEGALSLWYRAHAERDAGRKDAALTAWAGSLAADPLPLRAPLEADQVIREVAAAHEARLVDLAATIGPFPQASLFVDTLHPSPAGADRIAAALEPSIREMLGLPPAH